MQKYIQKKVMLVDSYQDGSSYWRVACDCGAAEHDAVLWFEVATEWESASLMVSTEVSFNSFDGFFRSLKKRFKAAFQILFLGHFRETGEVILNKDGIDSMIFALNEGKALLEKDKDAKNR